MDGIVAIETLGQEALERGRDRRLISQKNLVLDDDM